MDAARLVELGGRIVTLSADLMKARSARDEAHKEVTDLEKELMPLLAEHAQLIQGLAGPAMAQPFQQQGTPPQAPLPQPYAPPPGLPTVMGLPTAMVPGESQPVVQPVPGGGPVLPGALTPGIGMPGIAPMARAAPITPTTSLKARVKDWLKRRNSEDPVYASDIAEALHIDASIVREAMLEMRTASM